MSEMSESRPPRVFLSYSHDSAEHQERVLALCDRLRKEGVDAWIDQYETLPAEGWPRWAARQVRKADFVLVVCTEEYERRFRSEEEAGQGHGVRWEGYVATQELYDAGSRNRKFLPVVFPPWKLGHVPDVLRGTTRFDLSSEQGYQDLYRLLTDQPAVVPPPVGTRKPLPPNKQQANFSLQPASPEPPAQGEIPEARALETSYWPVVTSAEFRHGNLGRITTALPLKLESDHFVLHYGLRNPRQGRGLGSDGVGDPALVRWYSGALERLYQVMTSSPWSRPAPITDDSHKTQVYIFDLSHLVDAPFTALDSRRIPFICLSSRSVEPVTDSAMRRAAAEAVHEATHVFNAYQRPLHDQSSSRWAWFSEAFATFMESQVLPDNQDYFRYLTDWIDRPGISLNDWSYQACLFLHYLAGKLGRDFPNRVWMEAKRDEKPLEALQRLAPAQHPFASADPDQLDLFASSYAMDGYFLRDPAGGYFPPEVCSRFGDRAVVESFTLDRGDRCEAREEIPHLATHYFRIFPHRNVERIRFTLEADTPNGILPFKAEAAIVHVDQSRGQRKALRPIERQEDPGHARLTAMLEKLDEADLHHVVLVVSNCTLVELEVANIPPALSSYRIEIAAA